MWQVMSIRQDLHVPSPSLGIFEVEEGPRLEGKTLPSDLDLVTLTASSDRSHLSLRYVKVVTVSGKDDLSCWSDWT